MRRIGIIIDSVGNSGGTDRVAINLANELSESLEVSLITLDNLPPYYGCDERVNILGMQSGSFLRKFFVIRNLLVKNKIDIVLVISMGKLSARIIPLLKVFNKNTKIICSDHVAIDSFSWIIKKIKYFAYGLSDIVVTLTENDKEIISKKVRSKLVCIPNMSSFKVNKDIDIQLKFTNKIVLAIGRLTYQKNFKRLLDIWSNVKSSDWRLVIIGNGDELEDLKYICSQKKLFNTEIIPSTKEIESWYEMASILVMTSRYEGLPMVLIEAKSFGLPAISVNCKTGPSEIIKSDGYVVNTDEDFINKLNFLMHDENIYSKLSLQAVSEAENFSSKCIIEKWLKIL